MTTAARQHHNQLMLLQLTIGSPSNFSFYVLKFLSVYFCSSPEKGWSSFFSSCSFIYISSYLEVTAVVNIVSACVVMCVVPVSLLLMPLFSICLCYVCLRFSFLRSCFGKLLFCLLHLPLVWCLARGAASTLLAISRQCFARYLCILHGILVLMLCSLRVISPPSLVLSLHYLLGFLSTVVYMLSYATIKVVTFLSDSIVKCSQDFIYLFIYFFVPSWITTVNLQLDFPSFAPMTR